MDNPDTASFTALKEAYDQISTSYRQKKTNLWKELLLHVPELTEQKPGILLDVGSGNGRNLQLLARSLVVAIDLSEPLLRDFVADPNLNQRVCGALPKLPIRSHVASEVLSIAVIHHIRQKEIRYASFKEIRRILSTNGLAVVTVWRKWRKELKNQLIELIRQNRPIDGLVNHMRPWKNQQGQSIAYRFYHYYTFKELYFETINADLKITKRIIMGGSANDANFLIYVSPTS